MTDRLDLLFAALVVLVSFAPLLPVQGWQGYGPSGEYSCNCGQYYVRFSDPSYGGDRPHVMAVYQGFQVSVVQVSDQDSTVNALGVYSNFRDRPSLQGAELVVNYSSLQLNFTKTVSESDGAVLVDYSFGKNMTAQLTLWRWYYSSVGPYDRPVTRSINDSGALGFSFFDQGAVFNATVASDPPPTGTQISGVVGAGLNKITLDFQASSIALTVRVTSVRPLAGAGVLQVSSSTDAFPIIGVSVAAVYLAVRTTATRGRVK